MAAEGTPILIDEALIFCTPLMKLLLFIRVQEKKSGALTPTLILTNAPGNQFVCRGLAADQQKNANTIVYMGTNDSRLIAIDAETGQPAPDFGDGGTVFIDPGMDLWWPGEYQITSPPVVANGTVIVGSSISDNARVEAPRGTVRAFDAQTGEPKWSFDPIPRSLRKTMRVIGLRRKHLSKACQCLGSHVCR